MTSSLRTGRRIVDQWPATTASRVVPAGLRPPVSPSSGRVRLP